MKMIKKSANPELNRAQRREQKKSSLIKKGFRQKG